MDEAAAAGHHQVLDREGRLGAPVHLSGLPLLLRVDYTLAFAFLIILGSIFMNSFRPYLRI
jgi:hypothetical protein